MPPFPENTRNTLYCSFCGKSQHDVKKFIAGPTVFICSECIVTCLGILLKDEQNFTLESIQKELAILATSSKEATDPPLAQ